MSSSNYKKRRLEGEESQLTENRDMNKIMNDIHQLKTMVLESQKLNKMLLVQIKYQNNKIESLENKINKNDNSFDMGELQQYIQSCYHSLDKTSPEEPVKKDDFSYFA